MNILIFYIQVINVIYYYICMNESQLKYVNVICKDM